MSSAGAPRARRPVGALRGRGASQREAGYNLVFLAVMITVLNILVVKALPLWSAVIQREKEEELIFRGLQYAEAIRVYEKRTGGLPTKLEQLIEREPRSIRQLWKNPLDEDGCWELIPPGQGRQVGGRNLGLDQDEDEDRDRRDRRDRGPDQGRGLPGDPSKPNPSLRWCPGGENEIGSLPVFGIKSPVGGESIKTFVVNPSAPGGGSNEISEWLFTVELAKALIIPPDPSKPIVPSMNVAQRFRPWPPDIRPINVPITGARRGDGRRGDGLRGGDQRGGDQRRGLRGRPRAGASALEVPGQRNPSDGRRGGGG